MGRLMYLCPLCLIPTDGDRCTEGHHPTALIPGLDDSWKAGASIQKSRASRVSKCFQGDFRRAIKVIDPNGFDRPDDAHELFSRERATLTQLAHAHVIALIHAEEVAGRLCLITEYVPRTLEDVLRAAPGRLLTLPRAIQLAAQLADALAYMHDVGVIHRDLKPENLGLDDRDHLYVFDFGLAGVRRGDSATTVGVKGFSRPYAAPEQLDPKVFGRDGPWSDRYALGAILYELIAGRSHRPQGFSGGYEAYARQPVPPLPPDPARPAALDRLILQCLAVEAGARPRDTWAVLDVVAELADRLGTGLGEAHARFVQVEIGLATEQAALAEAQASVAEARAAAERIARQARTEQTAQRKKLAEERAAATDALARELASQRAAAEAALAEARASADRQLKHAKVEERAQRDRLAAERAAAPWRPWSETGDTAGRRDRPPVGGAGDPAGAHRAGRGGDRSARHQRDRPRRRAKRARQASAEASVSLVGQAGPGRRRRTPGSTAQP
ncbi:MAG: protein kinase [bacterium]